MLYTGRLTVKNNIYQAVINYKENGKYKTKWISTGLVEKGNKRRAEKFLREQLDKFNKIRQSNSEIKSFSKLVDMWYEVKSTMVKSNSLDIYKRVIDTHVKPYFDDLGIYLQNLEVKDFQAYFTSKSKTLKRSSLDKHYSIIHGAIEFAINTLEILTENKVKRVILPKKQKRMPSFYDEKEIRTLFGCVKGKIIKTPVRISATYGLRRSEVLGLMWKAIDFDLNKIIINHTAILSGSTIVYDNVVKADSSYRTLPLSKSMREFLLQVKTKQDENRKLFGNTYHESDYICAWEDGRPLSPNYITKQFPALLKKNNLRHIRFHDLRHLYVKHTLNFI